MSTVPLTDFYPWVLPEVVECPRVMVRDALRNSAIEFCERTKIWRDVQLNYQLAPTQWNYPYTAPASFARVWRVMRAVLANGTELPWRNPEYCDERFPRWRDRPPTSSSGPSVITALDDEHFIVVPPSGTTQTLTLDVALKPRSSASVLPKILFEDYRLVIAAGAKAALMAMKGQPWTDGPQALIYNALFTDKVNEANLRQTKGFGRAPLRVTGQFL